MRGLMKKLIIIPILAVLVSCGGGGTTSPELQTLQSLSPPPVSGSSPSYGTKVIDGYVEGANVFVDFNYNLTQDEGEPSGTFNADTNEYEFLESEFSAVNNFTTNCGLNRPRVAEVPVGAWDSTRGYVNDAYSMMYFPHDNGTGKANVTPFTTILVTAINQLLPSGISVADGCGTSANDVAESIKQDVNNFLYNLEQNFNINRYYFYDDFIASGDVTQQAIGEKVVDFLTTLHKIEGVLKQQYNMGFRGILTEDVIGRILNNESFSSVTFDIQNQTVSTQQDEWFRYNRRHNFNGIVGNSIGQILDQDSLPIEITMANLEANSTVLISENYEENKEAETIVSGYRVHISVEQRKGVNPYEKTFVRFVGNHSLELGLRDNYRSVIMSGKNASTSAFELRIRASNNPYFTDNVVTMMSTRNTSDIVQLYNDITTIDMSMSGSQSNVYLLYANDFNLYEGGNAEVGNWMFRQQMVNGSLYEECTHRDWETRTQIEQTTGTEAYNRCSEVL